MRAVLAPELGGAARSLKACQSEFPSIWHAQSLSFVDDGFGYFIASFRAFDQTFRFGRVATKVQAMHLKSLSEEAYQQ